MVLLTNEEKLFIIDSYARNPNITDIQRKFNKRFGFLPNWRTVKRIRTKFVNDLSLENKKRKRRRTVVTDENKEIVRAAFKQSPRKSTRIASAELLIGRTSLRAFGFLA